MRARKSVFQMTFIILMAACTVNEAPLIASTVDTSLFDGHYALVEADTFASLMNEIERTEDQERRKALETILQSEIDRYSDFVIEDGVIRSGKSIIQEFSLISGTLEGSLFKGRALWHEDIGDPGGMVEVNVELSIEDDLLYFTYHESDTQTTEAIVLVRESQDN